eukprot:TRINITY_DN91459_c0_g1_i1.p1 TRINITY_DN91459_c0_g1~~TRINITY_DN91459_c0_g1_i1.p1  ORF type:complete len:397 (-),score=75.48 TRINITY_DN91459_c0_g1_i1:289-1479(-)
MEVAVPRARRPWEKGRSLLVKSATAAGDIWLERVVLRSLGDEGYLLATPDSEFTVLPLKDISAANVVALDGDRAMPPGIAEADCYLVNGGGAHGGFSDDEVAQLVRDGDLALATSGIGTSEASPPGLGAGCFVMAEAHPRYSLGSVVPGSWTHTMVGGRVLADVDNNGVFYLLQWVPEDKSAGDYRSARLEDFKLLLEQEKVSTHEDVRTLAVQYREASGERHLPFDVAVSMMKEEAFDDFPVDGPRTTRWLCENIVKMAPGPVARHHRWLRDAEIPSGDRARHEHGVLSKVLETAVSYDGLNVCNLGSFEILCRRMQLLEEAHHDNPNAPNYDAADHFMGTRERKGGALLAPSLSQHVASRLRDEVAVLKEKRKANELSARVLAPKGGAKQNEKK